MNIECVCNLETGKLAPAWGESGTLFLPKLFQDDDDYYDDDYDDDDDDCVIIVREALVFQNGWTFPKMQNATDMRDKSAFKCL